MKHRTLFVLFLMLLGWLPMHAQGLTEVTGRVVHKITEEPLHGVTVSLPSADAPTTTNKNGQFRLLANPTGKALLTISGAEIITKTVAVELTAGELNVGDIRVDVRTSEDASMYAGIIDAQQMDMEDIGSGLTQDVSTMVIFSNDVFMRKAGFRFSPFRYRVRGYEARFEEKFINGVNFNEGVRGVFNYSSVGALNDLTRNGDVVNFMRPSTFTFGSIAGAENINMRPADFARGGKLTGSLANRNYIMRGMLTYATGLQDNGWAFVTSIGGRYSHRGAIPGTFYRNISYAIGAEKVWDNGKQRLSLVTYGSPVVRGQQGSSYQEANDLVGNNLYNPNWGFQGDQFRNAKVVTAFDPTAILSHVWQINEKSRLTTGIAAHYSRYGGTALNWYNGPDPRPDYYRYLPSYNSANELTKDYYTYLWQLCPKRGGISQINWDRLYMANEVNNRFGNGSAIYMVEERRSDLAEGMLNSTFNTSWSDNIHFSAGLGLKTTQAHQFKTVKDLMGARYLLDVDKFAERDFPGDQETIQNNLEKPGRRVYNGDVFGYDFLYHVNSANLWFQQEHNYHKLDVYYGGKIKYSQVQREGKMRNGRYPQNSFGRGAIHQFIDLGAKLGATYKVTGRHLLSANVSYQTVAPATEQLYVSPRITDLSATKIKSAGVFTGDVNYIFSTPAVTGRLSAFYTYINDDMKRVSYYHDSERTFVNHQLSGLDKRYLGVEFGANYKANDNWNFDLVGTVADYRYASNPDGVINFENGKGEPKHETVYMNNYHIGGVPEALGTFGINYFYNYWFLSANLNGFARNYVEPTPLRRVASEYTKVTPPEAAGFDANLYQAYQKLTGQERFKAGYTIDLSIGKIFYLKNRNSVNFNFSVNNVTNRKDIRTGGYEQGRLKLQEPDQFPSKYFYMQGINAFLNVSYRFK